MPPDWLILGAQKAGTTSLWHNLVEHPAVEEAWHKELQYFTLNYAKGAAWYEDQLGPRREGVRRGEGTPYYLFHPGVPERVRTVAPRVRLIVLLRNPVDRAWSHFRMIRRSGEEPLGFEDAIAAEAERLDGISARLASGEIQRSAAHQHFSYLARGCYADQLDAWRQHFPADQMLIVAAEEFGKCQQRVLDRVHAFLGLASRPASTDFRYNAGEPGESLPLPVRSSLAAYFRPHNERLRDVHGFDIDEWWGSS